MKTQLRWCVGKFVHPQGSSTLLHFMPLHDFHLDDALDIALLIALRSQRLTPNSRIGDQELSRWMDIMAIEWIAMIAAAVVAAQQSELGVLPIAEYDPGLGVVFEALQLTLARNNVARDIGYTAIGPASIRPQFELLHSDFPRLRYFDLSDEPLGSQGLTIINHVQAVRRNETNAPDLPLLLARTHGPTVLAARVCAGASASRRTTVRGAEVQLEPLDRLLNCCRDRDEFWRYRYISGHDAGYFLPADAPETGLLLAYTAGVRLDLPRFQAL
jgi:hypothetical protein